MKLNQVITGCALAAGLMAVAASSQAGVVIGNTLYAPAKVKATLTYVDDNGKYKKMSFDNKDILADAGYDQKGNQLAVQVSGGIGGIYVVNSKQNDLVADLVDEGYADVNTDSYVSTESDKSNSYKYSEQGYMDVQFYTGYSSYENEVSYGESYNVVDIYGNYSASYSEKYNNNNPSYNANFSLKANKIQAESYDYSWDSISGSDYSNYMPGTGSVSANGNGKLLYVD